MARPSEEITGEILEELRRARGLKQVEVAQRLHIDSSTISSYELGKIFPSAPVLVELANLYDVSIDYILGRTRIKANFRQIEEGLKTEKGAIELDDLLALSDRHKEVIAELVEAYRQLDRTQKK